MAGAGQLLATPVMNIVSINKRAFLLMKEDALNLHFELANTDREFGVRMWNVTAMHFNELTVRSKTLLLKYR